MAISFSNILENSHRRLNDEAISEFRSLVKTSIGKWVTSVDKEWRSLSPDGFLNENDMECYKGVLDDQYYLAQQVRQLSDELSITALYKLVEIHTKKVVSWHLPSIPPKKLGNIRGLNESLPFELNEVKEFSAFDELRELNNAIKHQGVVTDNLEKKYHNHGWVAEADLNALDKAYERLAPLISIYMDDLATKIYNSSERSDT
ncbi:hypothetical protein QTO16_01360 [Vibrio harveyi]|uniref:hypothetical protein n=1 Tax=Vibrio harveyi TaxID=669 RepID=UPI0002C47EF5|nr:hypothetical protein [Vibrio harveyi]EMR34580.1 hypothetical protein MUQ_22561 [Vibrio harveyi CAIM 1792]